MTTIEGFNRGRPKNILRFACLRAAWLLLALAGSFAAQAPAETLSWKGVEKDPHPCLYVTAKDVEKAKRERGDLAALAAMQNFNLDGDLDNVIAASLLTDNEGAKKAVIEGAKKYLDDLIKRIPDTTERNVGPHAYAKPAGCAFGLADAALAVKSISQEDRAAIAGKIAKACYMVNDPKYWNPEASHGSLCPNMFTSAAAYRLSLAALIPSHPEAKKWFDGALAELRQELADWVDPQGGVAETPHYSMVVFDQWLGAFLIARNGGAPDSGGLFDANMKNAALWFGNISTPRDPQNANRRRWVTVGHTYQNESSGTFGVLASIWKEKDPAFASEMQWMHLEHGSPGEPGILSYYPAFMGYRSFFRNSGVAPRKPALKSQYYQETGVQLRNVIGSDRETTLYMIAGRFHSHYFNDSGSITVWGKGSELCHEDDYQNRRKTEKEYKVGDYREAHSMIDKPATYSVERVMELKEFSGSPDLDYVSGVRMGWQRQIAFVKDADPLGPNYFVIADTVDDKSVPTFSRLFLRASQITASGDGVKVTGKEGVDMDVCLVGGNAGKPEIRADHIKVPVSKSGTVYMVLYPRLRSEQAVKVTPLEDGNGVKVVTPRGTDLVYLAPSPVNADISGKAFEGKVCLVKERGGKSVTVDPGSCAIDRTWWAEGDPQMRAINWKVGPQYPPFPDSE